VILNNVYSFVGYTLCLKSFKQRLNDFQRRFEQLKIDFKRRFESIKWTLLKFI